MSIKVKFSELEAAIKKYLNGEERAAELAAWLGIDRHSFHRWVRKYRAEGIAGLKYEPGKRYIDRLPVYSAELKEAAVLAYQAGEGSQKDICKRFGIRSRHALQNWIEVYNSGEEFKKQDGGSRMQKARKTSQDERIKIVKECLKNGRNYGEMALKYQVSYQQVYKWVKKFEEKGESGLEDRRGQRTRNQTPRTQEEALKERIAQLEHENSLLKMERDLLKKVKELERRDRWAK